ncbi:MAG: capsule assembly Wzi family protein [Acidobacteriaceae bacterium]
MTISARLSILVVVLLPCVSFCAAQSTPTDSPRHNPVAVSTSLPDAPQPQTAPSTPEQITLRGSVARVLKDQKAIWTSPLHLRPSDAEWLLPLGVATGVLIGSDHHTMTQLVRTNASDQKKASTLSNGTIVALGAIPAGTYLWSLFNEAPQAHETGLLAGEALADSLAVSEAFKFVSRRDRPFVNNAHGNFFSSSFSDSSFPSNHATAAWALASVVGDEYSGWLTRTAVYGMAATVSFSRIAAQKHFPSDVLVGSATGWLIGHYVYRTHHNFRLNPFNPPPLPADYGSASSSRQGTAAQALTAAEAELPPDPIQHRPPLVIPVDPDQLGSTNVPMDSWVYPALDRLAALGFIPTQSQSIRPWTRQECLRQLNEAEELANDSTDFRPTDVAEAKHLVRDLRYEFADEESATAANQSLTLESVYTRYGTIAGPALADSYHFGQTWWNDFGRPQGRGSNFIAGYAVRATHGRLFFYDRQELQHGPGSPAYSPSISQLIANLDSNPVQPSIATSAYDRQRPIELYAGVAFAGNAISLGKQELYWGPTTMGPLAFSSNAEPTYNLRFDATRPHPLPFLHSLGTYRFDLVMGKLSGHKFPERPWFNGQKIDFNFGDNLELSFTRWSILWGVGHPITLHSFLKNIFSFNSTGCCFYGDRADPGDRKSNFDFRYRLPGLRNMVTLYADAFSDDDPNPIDAPRRAVWNPGIYFARLPWLPHMDFRVEAVSSTSLINDFGGQHYFYNNQYHDANTNKGFMLGNAIGRDSRAIEGRTGYWFSARTRIEAGYRQNKGGTHFLPGGSTITDGFVNSSYAINRQWTAQFFTQYERFLLPSYMPGAQHNISGWLQLTWEPNLHLRR